MEENSQVTNFIRCFVRNSLSERPLPSHFFHMINNLRYKCFNVNAAVAIGNMHTQRLIRQMVTIINREVKANQTK